MHWLAARHEGVAKRYLGLFRALKYLPDGKWKNLVLNSLRSVEWPVEELPASRVEIEGKASFIIVPHPREFDFAAHLYRRMPYEEEVTKWVSSRAYDVVIEIGANVGLYTLLFSKIWPAARIFSFEPSRTAYRRLLWNLERNGCQNVFPFNCAVSSISGLAEFHEPVGHLTNGSLDHDFAAHFAAVHTTKAVTLGACELKKLIGRGERALIKIDVEGMEPAIVRALGPILAAERPEVIVEVLEHVAQELNQIESLKTYRRFHLTPTGPVERGEFIATPYRDYALIPR
jgi:FkbM family methyltransferase